MRDTKSNIIRIQLIVPFIVSLVLILASIQSILYLYLENEQKYFIDEINQEFNKTLDEALQQDAEKLIGFTTFIQHNTELQQSWLNQDRSSLTKLSLPIFQRLKQTHQVSHFYFHQTNGINFLRTHAPDNYGDNITRSSLKQAVATQQAASGIEFGASGQFVLRVVVPWIINGKLAGYVELGEEINHIIDHVASLHNTPIILSVSKDSITRNKLNKNANFLEKQANWDKYENVAIIKKPTISIPIEVYEKIDSSSPFKSHITSIDKNRYLVSSIFIKNFQKQNISKLTYLYDFESRLQSKDAALSRILGINIFIGTLLSIFYYLYSSKLQQSLSNSYKKLKSENKEREYAEEKLLESKHELELLIIERDKSLQDSELRYQTLFDKTADALMILGRDTFLDCNQATLDMFHYSSKAEIYNTHPYEISPEYQDDNQLSSIKADEMVQIALKTGSHRFEWNHVRKNGEIFPAEVLLTAIPSSEGPLIHAVVRDITARKKSEEEVKFRAYYDSLTKLPNRQLLIDRIEQAINTSRRRSDYNALLFLDLDRFKTINDSLGHSIGDALLIETAKRINSCIRDTDTAARFGGDEFITLLKHLGDEQEIATFSANRIAESLHALINKPFKIRGHELHVSCSIGICIFPLKDESPEDIIKYADTAMYSAKKSGRNRIDFYLSEMHEQISKRLLLEKDLRLAIKNKQLDVHYQPQLNNRQEVIGVEALLRWLHPVHGYVSPDEFIVIAEETGMISELGDFVLEHSITDIMSLQNISCMPMHLSINISPHQFKRIDFVKHIQTVMNQYNIKQGFLTLEVTEGVAINDLNDTIEKFKALREIGARMSLDDFGTGYSSLSYLKRLPLDELKIDKSFVMDVLKNPHDALLVHTILNIANEFSLDTVAEGVEESGQLDFLKDKGCKYYQGYYYSRPLPFDDLKIFLQKNNLQNA